MIIAMSSTVRAMIPKMIEISTKRSSRPSWECVHRWVSDPERRNTRRGEAWSPSSGLPNAAGTIPAPTAAAEPLLDPPGLRSVFQGLRVMEGSPCAKGVVTAVAHGDRARHPARAPRRRRPLGGRPSP